MSSGVINHVERSSINTRIMFDQVKIWELNDLQEYSKSVLPFTLSTNMAEGPWRFEIKCKQHVKTKQAVVPSNSAPAAASAASNQRFLSLNVRMIDADKSLFRERDRLEALQLPSPQFFCVLSIHTTSEPRQLFTELSARIPVQTEWDLHKDFKQWMNYRFLVNNTSVRATIHIQFIEMSQVNASIVSSSSSSSNMVVREPAASVSTREQLQSYLQLLETGEQSDAVIRLNDTESRKVHRTMLSAASPMFQAAFTSSQVDAKESGEDTIIHCDGMTAEEFDLMLRFIYGGELGVPDLHTRDWQLVLALLFAADRYQIDRLARVCVKHLKTMANQTNLTSLLDYCQQMPRGHSQYLKELSNHLMHEFQTWPRELQMKTLLQSRAAESSNNAATSSNNKRQKIHNNNETVVDSL